MRPNSLTGLCCGICFSADATVDLELDDLTVTEGVNMSASPRLRIVTVPSGGVQGLIQVPLIFSSSGASESNRHMLCQVDELNPSDLCIFSHSALDQDYMVTVSYVTFGDNSSTIIPQAAIEGTFTSGAEINILDDNILEDEEGINVVLLPSDRFVTSSGFPEFLQVTIIDNEGRLNCMTVQFCLSVYL